MMHLTLVLLPAEVKNKVIFWFLTPDNVQPLITSHVFLRTDILVLLAASNKAPIQRTGEDKSQET